MINGLEPLFCDWTGRRKGIPKGIDETHHGNLQTLMFIYLGLSFCFLNTSQFWNASYL